MVMIRTVVIEHSNGTREWYKNGKLYRDDGPAIEGSDGTREWYINGKRHRDDGPAVEHSNGIRKWYMDGNLVHIWYPGVIVGG